MLYSVASVRDDMLLVDVFFKIPVNFFSDLAPVTSCWLMILPTAFLVVLKSPSTSHVLYGLESTSVLSYDGWNASFSFCLGVFLVGDVGSGDLAEEKVG